jgi:hypothetical protein
MNGARRPSGRKARPVAWLAAAWALLAAGGAACGEDAEAAGKRMAERDARGLGWLLERGRQAVVRQDVAQLQVNPERRAQIERWATQQEPMFQKILASELEMIRQSCGGLDAAARRQILTTGQKLVKQTALGFAERQLTGQLGRDQFDPRQAIRTGLEAEVRRVAAADEFATYQREQADREARRIAAARLRIVAKLDQQLGLSADQRRAIEADLEQRWKAAWAVVLSEHSGRINNFPPAPDYAAAAIEPHLIPEQRAAWEAWSQAAGGRVMGQRLNWSFDGQGLQAIDPWWTR